jgi:hypothetical protein
MAQRIDKDSLKLDQPRRTPGHPTKSHVVKTKIDGKEKILRFGEQGAKTAGNPKAGESQAMKDKRARFKSRHAKNIAKGKSSPAFWSDKVKWAEGGEVKGMAPGGSWGAMAEANKAAASKERGEQNIAKAALSIRAAYGDEGRNQGPRDDRAPAGTYSGTGVGNFVYDLGDPEMGIGPSFRYDDYVDPISPEDRAYMASDPGTVAEPAFGPQFAPSVITSRPLGDNVAPLSQVSQPSQPMGFLETLREFPFALGRDLKMGYQAGLFRGRDTQRENLMEAGYTPAQIADYFARTDATLARNAAEAAMRGNRDDATMPTNYSDLARAFAQEYNVVGRNRTQLMPLLETFLRSRGILDPSTYSENIFNTLSVPMQEGGSVDLERLARRYADGGAVDEDEPSFFSLSGQERRRALDALNERIGEGVRYYLGPTPIPQLLGLATEMTPSRTVERASEASQRMAQPGLTPLQRAAAGAEMLGEVAAVGAPIAMGARGAMPMAEAAQEAFMGLSVPARAAAQDVVDRLNQPGPMPTLGSNFGNIGQGRPTLANLQDQPLAQPRRITPRDLEGARIIPTVADLTRAGGYYRGIDASEIDVPEPMMGGPGYPLLPSSQQAGLAWAVQGKALGTKKAGKGADLIAVTAMNPTSHKSNISFINSLIKTTEAYARDGRLRPETLRELDERVRAAAGGGDPALARLDRFPGFESPNVQEWINNASFQERSRIADIIGSKGMQDLGLPNINRVLQETVDPRYAGANPRDTLLFIEPDFTAPPVDLMAEGYPVHPSYRYGIRGRVFGALDQNVSTFEMFPDFWGEKNIRAFGTPFEKGGRRAFDLSLPLQEVTGKQVEDLERVLRTRANASGPTIEAASRLSPIDTRIVVNSMLDKWKPSTQTVKSGGVSPQAFVDAINNSKYKPALTNYTADDVKAGAKSGNFTVFQLGDDDVFFGVDAKPDYSWAGVEMMPEDKALVGVVSNAPGSKGTAVPSVMAKALEEGVTILDAFAVPSKRYPEGFLPEYYGEFGFQEAGRVPFDPDLYIADHGEQAYKDLRAAWKSDGWDESMGMPPVVVMRWSGSDADRTATAAGIRGAGAPSHRAATGGLVAEAEGSAGRISDQTLPQGAPGDGRRDLGESGDDNRARLSDRARKASEGLLGLTPRELQNRGISREQIEELVRKYERDLPPDFARGGDVRSRVKGYAAGGMVSQYDPAMIDQIVNRVRGAGRG